MVQNKAIDYLKYFGDSKGQVFLEEISSDEKKMDFENRVLSLME